jgi:SAM-dependent methyltransferase
LEIDSGNAATLDLLDHAAGIYPAVASGDQTGEEGLFGPKGIALWLSYFNNSNLTYAVNNWVGAVLAATHLRDKPKLRILELGAGAGSATETLLGAFDNEGLLPRIDRYLITEPNAFFRRRAQRDLFSRYSHVPLEFGALDLNLPWSGQIAPGAKFDLVFAVNVLHVSKDLLFSLGQARSVLSDDGWLILGECIRPYPNQPIYPELMFQNLDSFINVHTDPDVRPRPGFLTADQWRHAFHRAGFVQTEVAPDVEQIRMVYPHFFTGAIAGRRLNDDSSSNRS